MDQFERYKLLSDISSGGATFLLLRKYCLICVQEILEKKGHRKLLIGHSLGTKNKPLRLSALLQEEVKTRLFQDMNDWRLSQEKFSPIVNQVSNFYSDDLDKITDFYRYYGVRNK